MASHFTPAPRHPAILAVFVLALLGGIGFGCQTEPEDTGPIPVDSVYSEGTPYETDVPYVATPQPVVETMLELAQVTEGDVVYDLGSGDGRMVLTAAQQFGARGVGIEIVPELVEQSRSYARLAGVSDQVQFYRADLFDTDLSEATVLSIYLLPDVIERLLPKIRREMDPGDRVVSHNYGAEAWPPDSTVEISANHVLYLWTIRDSTSVPLPTP
jgi:SAM-dependent methyltransferase